MMRERISSRSHLQDLDWDTATCQAQQMLGWQKKNDAWAGIYRSGRFQNLVKWNLFKMVFMVHRTQKDFTGVYKP